jgi:hypothetical protein
MTVQNRAELSFKLDSNGTHRVKMAEIYQNGIQTTVVKDLSSSYNVQITFNSDVTKFVISRDATVDDLYVALAKALDVSVSDAHKYKLTCEKTQNAIDAELGQTKLTELAKPFVRKSKQTLKFTAEEIEPVRICVLVTDLDSDSDSSSDASSELSSDSDSTYETESTDTSADSYSSSFEDVPENPVRTTARIYLNHEHGDFYDEILMRRDGDQIKLTYSYDRKSNSDTDCSTNIFHGSVDEIVAYAGRILRLLAIDRKPYSEIEVDIPFYPAISVVSSDLLKKPRRTMILAALREFLEEGVE